MKKTLALVLALCMALTTLVAFADETYTYNLYMSSFPTTWNPFQYQTETDGTMVNSMSDASSGASLKAIPPAPGRSRSVRT